MMINPKKSMLTPHNMGDHEFQIYATLFPYDLIMLDEGLKYVGFRLKSNYYKKEDWTWLLAKLEKRINVWSHRWISKAGILVLVKSVLEAILVCWIPKSILEKARRICSKFCWIGKAKTQSLLRSTRISFPIQKH